jgi:hypothetical protein
VTWFWSGPGGRRTGTRERSFITPELRRAGSRSRIGLEVAKWLASKKVACVGADNWGVEVYPNPNPPPGVPSPVNSELIVKNGIPHQESMVLSELAKDAAMENDVGPGRDAYTFAYIFVPVPVKGA